VPELAGEVGVVRLGIDLRGDSAGLVVGTGHDGALRVALGEPDELFGAFLGRGREQPAERSVVDPTQDMVRLAGESGGDDTGMERDGGDTSIAVPALQFRGEEDV